MKTALAVIFVLATVYTALAQNNAIKSPAGEPAFHVRSGAAKLVGHFDNPKQMLRLAFGLVPPHLAEEEEFLQELMTPGSPQFRQFLTPEQWDARFAPSVEDEQAVVDWATSQGLTITHRYPNRLIVDVEAPIATIEKALQVKINNYLFDGYTYISNEREPVIPAHLSGIIRSVGGLHNFPQMRPEHFSGKQPPGPLYIPGPVVGVSHTDHSNGHGTKRRHTPANSSYGLLPNFTAGAYDPNDIYSSNAYDYDALQNLQVCCNPLNYTGGWPVALSSPPESSIALATYGNLHTGVSPVFPDIDTFSTHYGLEYNVTTFAIDGGPATCVVDPTIPQPCDNDLETALDTEWSTATGNSFDDPTDTAHVYVYEDGGIPETMYSQMATDGYAKIFSTSWSCTEIYKCSSSEMDSRHAIFNTMVGEGWTLMTASGDRGATDDCSHISVSYPASDPDVIGVGGTDLTLSYPGPVYAGEVAWTGGSGSGSCSNNNGGSGGGCSVKYTLIDAPFQTGANGTCGLYRSVPDIALNASEGQNMYFNLSWFGIGGTSISSPMLAGFFAQEGAYLVYLGSVTGDSCGYFSLPCTPIGPGNPYLYFFGQHPKHVPHYPFYDIASGSNTNDIVTTAPPAFTAVSGYDSVTGWGSANMLQLAWAINTFIAGDFGAPDVTFSGPSTNTWSKTPQNVQWSIDDTTANGATPNGVAGFSAAWDFDVGDSISEPTPGTGNSFYSGPLTVGTTGSLTLNSSLKGCHTAHVRAWDNGGTTSDETYGPVCFDDIPPVVLCGSPDILWHATDQSIACTASDSLSGLAVPADASFYLWTNVPAGTATATATTCTSEVGGVYNSLAPSCNFAVSDVAGNVFTQGPIGPIKVDKSNPVITITAPTATTYTHDSTLTLKYNVTDTGSGPGTITPTMNGSGTVGGSPIHNLLAINLLTALPLGPNTFAITALDNVLNMSSKSVTFTIIVTPQSIINDVKDFFASGAISKADLERDLLEILKDAQKDRNRGQCRESDYDYQQFIDEVWERTGHGITSTAAAILIADAQYLENNCL